MNPRQFLLIGGIILVALAVFGFVVPQRQGSFFWLDSAENWAHLVLGVAAIAAVYALPASVHGPLTLAVGVLGLLVGLYGFMSPNLLGANLENPADNILHLAVGAWAVFAWWGMKKAEAPMPQMPMPNKPM